MRHNVRCVGQGVGVAQLVAVDVSGEPRSWTELGSDHLPVGGVVEEFLDELTPRWTGPPVADARDDYRDGAVHALVSTLLLFDRTGTDQTDVPIAEHATDTHGASLINFALFDLVGLQLSPRIRDLSKITLYRTGSRASTGRYVARSTPHAICPGRTTAARSPGS